MGEPPALPTIRALSDQARTLRERALARMLHKLVREPGEQWRLELYIPPAVSYHQLVYPQLFPTNGRFELICRPPPFQSLRQLMRWLRRNEETRRALSRIPLSSPHTDHGEQIEQLCPALQDLAELIAHEGHMALTSQFYAGMPEVGYISPRRVKEIMEAMSGELRREYSWVTIASAMGYYWQAADYKPPKLVLYTELPYERQLALAQRRRYWFRYFGITHRRWKERMWSLWRVPDEPPPAGYQLSPL